MIYEQFDVVVVPFPFTDSAQTKRRPALVLSQNSNFGNKIGHSVLAMITSKKNASWPLDCEIMSKKQSGLTAPSVVRMKLFTLDNRFIIRKIGHLSGRDEKKVKRSLSQIFDYLQWSSNRGRWVLASYMPTECISCHLQPDTSLQESMRCVLGRWATDHSQRREKKISHH